MRVESLLPGDVDPPGGLGTRYFVHAGPFQDRGRADAARMDLAMVGADQATIVRVEDAFAVRIGPLSTRWDAERLQALLLFREQARSEGAAHAVD
ncbi:MAG: SPOR domain-containing protein [Gammaproteobacteria bacterium]|nr:SPOR domain-containing protein [Gammaproteobacteria bacterium]